MIRFDLREEVEEDVVAVEEWCDDATVPDEVEMDVVEVSFASPFFFWGRRCFPIVLSRCIGDVDVVDGGRAVRSGPEETNLFVKLLRLQNRNLLYSSISIR